MMDLEEVKQYLIHFQTFKDNDSFKVLLENYKLYLYFLYHKFKNFPLSEDELNSSILFGFYNAVLNFDCEKNTMKAITSYIWTTVFNQLAYDVRVKKRNKDILILDENVSEDNNVKRVDLIAGLNEDDIFNLAIKGYDQEVILEMLNCLTPKQQEIIKYRYGICGYPLKKLGELANYYGCSKQYISNEEHHALQKMRRLYSRKYSDLI